MIEALLQAERLLIHGMLDEAEKIYAAAAEQDPGNSIAHVGLCRVALERGEDEVAHGHARRALELDPENAAALRFEARLAEVLAARQAPPSEREAEIARSEPGPSERYAFDRNPSMADHRRAEEQRPSGQPNAEPREAPAAGRREGRRGGFLRRLLGQ